MFVAGPCPVPGHEVYVGLSRARLLLAALIDSVTASSLPATLRDLKSDAGKIPIGESI